ncbi:hypothetical protein ABW19_dt0208901 [Dactylella cylindrospora]|nr:hypothetical protein ABW19_dt0208901 [Dactylella cylindrospora]
MTTYVRSGRGGAGNFAPKEAAKPLEVEMQNKRRSADLEAQPIDPADAASIINAPSTTPAPQYKTYARGGAGNWYEPAALKETGHFSTDGSTESAVIADASKRSSRVWQGRGGAGNWEADQTMKDEIKRKSMLGKTDEEAAMVEAIREEAKLDAEKEIQPPESAHVHVPHLDRHKNLGDETHDI